MKYYLLVDTRGETFFSIYGSFSSDITQAKAFECRSEVQSVISKYHLVEIDIVKVCVQTSDSRLRLGDA